MGRIEVYKSLKDQVMRYVAGLAPAVVGSRCVACPAWSLQDVVAHHVYAQRCWIEGVFPPAALAAITAGDEATRAEAQTARDTWSDQGVIERRGWSLEQLSDEWDEVIGRLTEESMPLVLDLTVHFDDIRETVEGEVPRNEVDTMITLHRFHAIQAMKLEARGIGPLALFSIDDNELISTTGEPAPTVRGTTYDLLRCLTSRRTKNAADLVLEWESLPEPAREAFPVYGWPH